MTAKKANLTSAEKQRKFIAGKKAAGLKRLLLWVLPEDEESLKMISQQPHAMARYRAKIERKFERDLGPEIKREVSERLDRKTTRAMKAQRRAQARRMDEFSNLKPEMIRFLTKPPAILRNELKYSGWLYDPVANVWHLPNDPADWLRTDRLLGELHKYRIERLFFD